MRKEAKIALVAVVNTFVILSLIAIVLFIGTIKATSSGSSGNANLTIYDDTDTTEKLTSCNVFCVQKAKSSSNKWNDLFYANFTNSSGSVINSSNGNGNATISFNITGVWASWQQMTYNSSSFLWQFNRSFNYDGTLNFSVNVTSTYGNLTIYDSIFIGNTLPYIIKDASGFIDFNADETRDTLLCNEDTICSYNFSANVSEDDLNDILFFNYTASSNTTLANFTLNTSTGILTVNVTNNNNTGFKQVELSVKDEGSTQLAILQVNITAVNDAPQFVNLANQSFNASSLFEYIINVTDEENNIPFSFNITFLNCTVAQWSDRNCSNSSGRILFNTSQYTTNGTSGRINISFTPTRNDVGNYTINFTVTDSGTINPANATTSQIVNFAVLNVNVAPYFRYVCDNERSTTENSPFNCYINVSDIDEINNLTITANYTWFKFNSTGTNTANVTVNTTTNFNGTFIVNFSATDTEVGNWSLNISLRDTGSPVGRNSTVFYFYIGNINDTVSIDDIANITAYTSNNYTIYVNATDDDLLILDKSVYNENLTFTSNDTNVNVSATTYISGTNKTQATITFNPNILGNGNRTINITVRDRNNFSIASDLFTIQVFTNNPPIWNSSTQTNHTLIEGTNFYLNLSQNVTDDGSVINFSFSNDTAFSSFSINITTGIINFTPIDADVGQHIVVINATDGITPTPLTFNFTVRNINDTPVIQTFPANSSSNGGVSYNYTGNSSIGQINVTEDSVVRLELFVHDDDLKIPSNQKSFYRENITVNLTIQGPNSTLFRFVAGDDWSGTPFNQRQAFRADFTPRKGDVGNYNITINATDNSSLSHTITFNFTVLGINHAPNLTKLGNIVTSVIESIYANYNVTDLEDKNESFAPGNFTFIITNLTGGGNFLNASNFNRTTGVLNFTFSQQHAGFWVYNISVNDSSGLTDSEVINLTIYDYPKILSPSSNTLFNLVENNSYQFNFTVNSTVGSILNDTLNYTLIINGFVRNSTNGNGNASIFGWNFAPNFTDETTCSGAVNLTLNVSNAKLSNSTTWNLTINHTNAPLTFSGSISDISGGSPSLLTLSNYFSDIDASNSCTNQTIGFIANLISGSGITASVANWTSSGSPNVSFSASVSTASNYSVIAYEYNGTNYSSAILSNATSNNFSVTLTVSTTVVQTPSSGGGSSTVQKLISLKIIVPEPVSSKKKDKLVVPIGIVNDGEVDLNDIVLSSLIAKGGFLRSDLISSFDRSFIKSLPVGKRENVTLIVDVDTNSTGIFEVTLNGTVKSPKYSDYGKFYIEIRKDDDVLEKIVFTEEFVVGNPECTELKEAVDEAKRLYAAGDLTATQNRLDEIVFACRKAIAQPVSKKITKNITENLFAYVSLASVIALGVGFGYYQFRKIRLKRQIANYTAEVANAAAV